MIFRVAVGKLFGSHYSTRASFKDIHPFGSLFLRCPNVKTSIRPINPFEILDGNEAIFTINNNSDDSRGFNIKELFQIEYSNKESKISLIEREIEAHQFENISLDIEIPHNYNVVGKGLAIHVKETEGKILNLQCVQDCILGKIKSDQVYISASGGKVVCKSLLGTGCISAGNDVIISKVQSKHLDVRSDTSIKLSTVYCNQLNCLTDTGSIELGSLHGYSDLKTDSGSISVSSLAGDCNIQTNSGDISMTIESCRHVFATSEQGNIDLGLSDSVSAFLDAKGCFIDVPPDLLVDGMQYESSNSMQSFEGKLGSADSTILVKSGLGTVRFSRKNWFSKFTDV